MEDYRQKQGPEKYDEKWESLTSAGCCGDEIMARAFLEVGVHLTPSFPRIQGETVSTLDWTKKHWCAPAISWHHVSPAQVDAMWQYQMRWVKNHVRRLLDASFPPKLTSHFLRAGTRHISTKTSLTNSCLHTSQSTAPDGTTSPTTQNTPGRDDQATTRRAQQNSTNYPSRRSKVWRVSTTAHDSVAQETTASSGCLSPAAATWAATSGLAESTIATTGPGRAGGWLIGSRRCGRSWSRV